MDHLLAVCRDSRETLMVRLLSFTGLRLSVIQGLRWIDVWDFVHGVPRDDRAWTGDPRQTARILRAIGSLRAAMLAGGDDERGNPVAFLFQRQTKRRWPGAQRKDNRAALTILRRVCQWASVDPDLVKVSTLIARTPRVCRVALTVT